MASLGRAQSLPYIMSLGTTMPKGERHHKKTTLAYRVNSGAVDLHPGLGVSAEATELAKLMSRPDWRLAHTLPAPAAPSQPGDMLPRNMRVPRVAPAWLKHDKQVLRFYGFYQEHVTERSDENSRYRNLVIMYFMEDGTLQIAEPKVENSGIPQGMFLKRHRMPRPDGTGFLGPDDLRCGEDASIYGKVIHITGCDRFTRWFYEENGIDVGEDEDTVQDLWQKTYRSRKTAEQGGLPLSRAAVEAKTLTKFMVGQPPADRMFTQFLLNDRKVLRFKAYWDDHTAYGARVYFIIHYYLANNTVEINEAHARNSGRDNYPVFMKRGPLYKANHASAVPAMMTADREPYLPEDLLVGSPIKVWGRSVMLYDCDDFTQKFYQEYMEIDQKGSAVDVSEKPLTHAKLAPPPHNGIGSEEDSLISCKMIQPKAPKMDVVKLMTLSGEVLRFEAKMANGEPEDETRRLVIAFYPMDDQVAVFEIQQRNSGHMGGKFAEKKRMKNPDTGKSFQLTDLYVGKTVTIAAQPLQIIRADEHCLQFLEARPDEFPYANPKACARKLAPLAGCPEMRDEAGVDPDRLKELAAQNGVDLVDHEVITLLRRFSVSAEAPALHGPKVLELMGMLN